MKRFCLTVGVLNLQLFIFVLCDSGWIKDNYPINNILYHYMQIYEISHHIILWNILSKFNLNAPAASIDDHLMFTVLVRPLRRSDTCTTVSFWMFTALSAARKSTCSMTWRPDSKTSKLTGKRRLSLKLAYC